MISLKTEEWQIDNIETVLFDKDGTLIDLHYFWGQMTLLRCNEIIKKFNLPENVLSELCFFLGYDLNTGKMLCDGITALYSRSVIIEIFKKDLEKLNVFVSEKELEEIFDNVSKEFYQNMFEYIKPINGAIDFVKSLKSKGIKLGIVTSDSVESTNLTLKYFNWEHFFDVVIGRESSSKTKESGALSEIALTQLCANPDTTIMIGDAPMDFLSAKNANIQRTILISTGQIQLEDLKKISNYTTNSFKNIVIAK